MILPKSVFIFNPAEIFFFSFYIVIPGKESVTVNQPDSASLSPTEFVATNVCCRPMDEPDEEQTINVAEHPSVSGDSMTYANEPSVPNGKQLPQ